MYRHDTAPDGIERVIRPVYRPSERAGGLRRRLLLRAEAAVAEDRPANAVSPVLAPDVSSRPQRQGGAAVTRRLRRQLRPEHHLRSAQHADCHD